MTYATVYYSWKVKRNYEESHYMLEDNNPYRRNYMLASIGFLLYFTAGGHLIDTKEGTGEEVELAFGMINIAFNKPWVIGLSAFFLWAWTSFRYWQKTPNRFPLRIKDTFSLLTHYFHWDGYEGYGDIHLEDESMIAGFGDSNDPISGRLLEAEIALYIDPTPFVTNRYRYHSDPRGRYWIPLKRIDGELTEEELIGQFPEAPKVGSLLIYPKQFKKLKRRLFFNRLTVKDTDADWLIPHLLAFAAIASVVLSFTIDNVSHFKGALESILIFLLSE
jgi:hypothetical protein